METRLSSPLRRPSHAPLAGLVLGIFFVILGSALPALAEKGIDLNVVDNNGKKLGFVTVVLEAQDGSGFTQTLTANKRGNVKDSVKGPAGAYKATFTLDGYAPYTADLNIVDDQVQQGTITMVDQATANLQRSREAFNEGVAKLRNNDEDEALKLFQESMSLDPTLAQPHGLTAMVLANQKKWDEAATALDAYLELSPNGLSEIPAIAPSAYMLYRHQGDAEAKAKALEILRANDMAKDVAPDIYNEGVEASKGDNTEAAEALFLEALDLDPALLPAYTGLAALNFNNQKWEKAVQYADQLLAKLPRSRDGQRMAFFANWELGNKEQAEAHAKAWFELTDDGKEEVTRQAEASFENNETDRALSLAEIVTRNAPDFAKAHYLLGRILASSDVPAAKKELQRFLELAPDDPDADAAKQMLAGL